MWEARLDDELLFRSKLEPQVRRELGLVDKDSLSDMLKVSLQKGDTNFNGDRASSLGKRAVWPGEDVLPSVWLNLSFEPARPALPKSLGCIGDADLLSAARRRDGPFF